MKILFLHNKYLLAGGEDISTALEIDLLRSHGHTVKTIIVDNRDILKISIRLAANTIWSMEKYKKIKYELQKERYDIVHVQNFFPQLSPSIFYAAHETNTKIVMSVRNYRLVCPNALLFVNNNICTACVGKKIPYPGVLKKCYRNNFLASLVTASMLSVHNILQTWNKKVDGFICISSFVKEQLILGGIAENKLFLKPNFIINNPISHIKEHRDFLFVGRLSVEKGIDVLLNVFEKLPDKKLIIIGYGPLEILVNERVKKSNNITFYGKKSREQINEIMSSCKYLICPSSWHEPFGRSIIESLSNGTPVITTNVGGAKEIIKNAYNGFLFEPKNENELMRIIKTEESYNYPLLRANSRKSFENNFTPEINYTSLIAIYEKILNH